MAAYFNPFRATPRVFVVTGPIGSKKDQVFEAVLSSLNHIIGKGSAQEMTIASAFNELSGQSGEEGLSAFYGYLSELDGKSRTLILYHCLARAYQLAEKKGSPIILANGFWHEYAAYELAYGVPREVVMGAARGFVRPDETLFIEPNLEQTWLDPVFDDPYRGGLIERRWEVQEEPNAKIRAFHEKVLQQWEWLEQSQGPWHRIPQSTFDQQVAQAVAKIVSHLEVPTPFESGYHPMRSL